MSYQALLFSGDEKTSRIIKQLLSDLEFTVEIDAEPFSAVKRVVGQHFDALVVDCGNEQNAALLFKSARNSGSNSNSLLVAVVDGQAGIANAFRIGANFVLTKPINLDQCKSTLRVARNLLRKGETDKAAPGAGEKAPLPVLASDATAAEVPAEQVQSPIIAPLLDKPAVALVPSVSATAVSPSDQSAAKPDHAAAFFASLSDEPEAQPAPLPTAPGKALIPASVAVASGDGSSKQAAATALAKVKEPSTAAVEVLEPKPPAGADPAKADSETKPTTKKALPATGTPTPPGALPRFASLGAKTEDPDAAHDPEQSRKNFFIAAVIVLALGAAAYFGWNRFRPDIHLPFLETQQSPVQPQPAVVSAQQPAVQPTSGTGSDAQPAAQASAETTLQSTPTSTGASASTPLPAAAESTSSKPGVPGEKEKTGEPARSTALPGKSNLPKQTSKEESARPAGAGTAAQATEVAKVSQDISEGLLVKKVPPLYPSRAKERHLEGLVQLEANINKEGHVSAVKVLQGDPVLAKSASDAVRQWKYKPYVLNGEATEIQTEITVNFKLP